MLALYDRLEWRRTLRLAGAIGAVAAAITSGGTGQARSSGGAVSILQFIPAEQHRAIQAGTSRYDATSAIHMARDAVDGTGAALIIPPGTYFVGEVKFSGSHYRIETQGVTFRQRPGLTGDDQLHPIITFTRDAHDIRLGNIRLVGNIATDQGEYSHGIAVSSADNITIGDVYGEDIRGDVLYTYGRTTSEAEIQRNLVTGVISGRNIFRCIVAMAGGDARIAGIVQDGPIGYRDFDAEPNSGGAYQPVTAHVGFVRGSVVQITSDDPQVVNFDVVIDHLDLDGRRIANSVPAYRSHAGANAIALSINRVTSVRIDELSVRNYPSYPIALFDRWRSIRIGTLEYRNSNTVETTYKTIVLQHGRAGEGVLAIDRIVGRLADPSRMVLRADRGSLHVEVGQMDDPGGIPGLYLSGRIGGRALKSKSAP